MRGGTGGGERRADGGSGHPNRGSCRRPGCGSWSPRRGGLNATPGSAGAGPSRAGTGCKGESSPRSPPRRRPAAGPPRPARHRHAPRADPTPLPAPPHAPRRPHQPAGSRGNPAPLPPEVGQRQRRTCAPPSARAAGPPRSMRQPPGAVHAGRERGRGRGGAGEGARGRGGGGRERGKPARPPSGGNFGASPGRLRAWSCPAPD